MNGLKQPFREGKNVSYNRSQNYREYATFILMKLTYGNSFPDREDLLETGYKKMGEIEFIRKNCRKTFEW